MLGHLSPRRRALFGFLAAAVVCAGVALTALALKVSKPAGRGGVPVILIHGYGGGPGSLQMLDRRLVREHRSVVLVTLRDRGRGDLLDSARTLERAVEDTGASRVDLVGFSAGGIVVRTYLARLDGVRQARRVVLLGTPNHGTKLAEVAGGIDPSLCVGACPELVPGSLFLDRLNGDETPEGPAYTSIWTQADQIVTPPSSALLKGALNVRLQDVCRNARVAHGDLVGDPLAVGLVVAALDDELRGPPGAADCSRLRSLGRLRS